MDLREAGLCKFIDQLLCAGHGFLFGQILPRQGAEMVAGENDLLLGHTGLGGELHDELIEISRVHAGIAAVLVDLIGGRLDQDRLAGGLRARKRSLQHKLVCAAVGRNADLRAALAGLDHRL